MAETIIFKEESYTIVGICMEIHKALGMGLKEINYKDAMEIEFKERQIPYEREKRYKVIYKNKILGHPYIPDFFIYDSIIVEVKSAAAITEANIAQTLSYLRISQCKLGMVINFGEKSLTWQRVVL
jgi:GxxExxY protein